MHAFAPVFQGAQPVPDPIVNPAAPTPASLRPPLTRAVPTLRIEGTGPVALAAALWLVRAGVPASQIALPLADEATSILPASGPRRALALSAGSCQILSRLVALPPSGRIGTVEIFQAGTNGHARIEAEEFMLPALGHVVQWEALIRQLHEAARLLPFASPDDPAFASPSLRIHAGGLPPADRRNDRDFSTRDSGQSGLLFEVECNGTRDTAFECFCPEGPLALLPAPPQDGGRPRFTVVWCDAAAATRARAQLNAEALGEALQARLRAVLGLRAMRRQGSCFQGMQVCTPAVAVPLPRVSRRQVTAPGEVWIGNAAQALHPVAGQGLNLGLRDAFVLARLLGDAWRQPVPDIDGALRAHARERQRDRALTIGTTDLFAVAFGWPLAGRLQSVLLRALHVSPALRRPLANALVFGHR